MLPHTKVFALVFLLVILAPLLRAQPILLLNSQAEVDSVPILYPNLTEVYALSIGFLPQTTTLSDIHDLAPLSSIQRIVADISIRNNPHLTSLHGLHNIDTIVGYIYSRIENNDSLLDLSELQVKHIGEELQIKDNDRLESLTGLEGITELNILGISGNTMLASLTGLDNLEEIADRVSFSSNHFADLNLPKLRKVRSISVHNEPELVSLNGLENLDSIGNFLTSNNGSISFYELPKLASFSPLESLTIAPGTNIAIEDNLVLEDVLFLEAAIVDSLTNIRIKDNPLLQSIASPDLRAAKALEIVNNAALTSISFPNLESLDRTANDNYEGLIVMDNPSLLWISMPMLNRVGRQTDGGNDVSFVIENNDSLQALGVIGDSLVVDGSVRIAGNELLVSIEGLEGLKSVGQDFVIESNPNLHSLCDFVQFDSIGAGLGISGNSLASLDGLQTLRYVGISLGCGNDSMLADVSALNNLDSIGLHMALLDPWDLAGIGIGNAPSLKRIDFSATNIKLFPRNRVSFSGGAIIDTIIAPFIEDTESISIQNNPNLKHLSFPNIQAVGLGQFTYWPSYIRNNASLTSLDGISTITTMVHAPDSLVIRDNPLLWDCEAICRILDRGQTLPSRFKLGGNAFPCNSVGEVEEHICDTLTAVREVPGLAQTGQPLLAMPNPTAGVFAVQLPDGAQCASFQLTNAGGRTVFAAEGASASQPFDIGHLPAGVYFATATDQSGRRYQGKLAKR